MKIIEYFIISYWKQETGIWSNVQEKYFNRKWSDVVEKTLAIRFLDSGHTDDRGIVVRFNGGPTGFESYYLGSLIEHNLDNGSMFCICGGTINSWHNCEVKSRELHNIIKQYQKEI